MSPSKPATPGIRMHVKQLNKDIPDLETPQVGSDLSPAPDRRILANDVLNSVGECVYEWDIVSDELLWSEGAANLFCLNDLGRIATNRAFNGLMLPTSGESRADTIMSSKQTDTGLGIPYRIQYALSSDELSTSSDIWVEDNGRWFAGRGGKPERAHGVIRIVNERRNLEERLSELSRFDPLTGLFNRTHLNVCLDEMFKEIEHSGENASFLVVGLEHFDLINSVYGYDAGDAAIVEVAKRIKENLRDEDTIGRFSGAKVGIILPECGDRDLMIAGYRILNLLREKVVTTEQGPIVVSASIGGVVLPQHARDPREAFLAAHQALSESRRTREGSVIAYQYDARKDEEHKRSAQLAETIMNALEQGRIQLAWQPIVDAKSSEIVFHEALIRLQAASGEQMPAGDFVSIAQSLGMIRLVDHHALDLAIEALIKCPTAHFSLNVSNDTAADPEWLSKLANAVHAHGHIAGRLIVEITESQAAESLEETASFIASVKDLGLEVALDDFGAGFTSFRNLKALPFDIIKIDGQFVDDLGGSHVNQSFIRALVDLARLFDSKTVVEWVEDGETASLLRDWGVDYLQGYKFGKPQLELPWPVVEVSTDAPASVQTNEA